MGKIKRSIINDGCDDQVINNKLFIKQFIIYLIIIVIHIVAAFTYCLYTKTYYSNLASNLMGAIAVLSVSICFSTCSKFFFDKWWFVGFSFYHSKKEGE